VSLVAGRSGGKRDNDEKNVNIYLPSLMMKLPDHLYVLGDTYTSHVNKVQLIRVKTICVAVLRVTCMCVA
jgi:hypothetical protein